MRVLVFPSQTEAIESAADLLAKWLTDPQTRRVMVAAGNTPLPLYREISKRKPPLSHLEVFTLDEYVGVPKLEPRNCANLLRREVVQAWNIPEEQFHAISSLEEEALPTAQAIEHHLGQQGGLDVIVLGLGQNGHIGFNEPGSSPNSLARMVDLEQISIEANRKWFGGQYAPSKGITTGLKTILAARRTMVLAFGAHKATAVSTMLEGPVGPNCPASFIRQQPGAILFLDESAAAGLSQSSDTSD